MLDNSRVDQLLRDAGFTGNPFGLREAERGGRNESATSFFEHPLFPEVLGRADHVESVVVLAQRGAGKTTFRQAIEFRCRKQRPPVDGVLDVAYTEFSRVLAQIPSGQDATIWLHVDEILRCAVPRLLEGATDLRAPAFTHLSASAIATLSAYVHQYTRLLDPDDYGHTLNRLLEQIAHDNTDGPPPPFDASPLLGEEGQALLPRLPAVVQPAATLLRRLHRQSPRRLDSSSYLQLIRDFLELVRAVGYQAMYVLVDRLDETALFPTPEGVVRFLKPLLTALDLLEEAHLAFKIFVPQHLQTHIARSMDFRSKRLMVRHLAWSDDDLLDMLATRLRSFHPHESSSLQILCEPSLGSRVERFSRRHPASRYVDAALVRAAHQLPRDLILRCRQLLGAYAARDSRGLITEEDLEVALTADLGSDDPPPTDVLAVATPPAPAAAPPTRLVALPPGSIPPAGLFIDENELVWRDGKSLDTRLRPLEFKLLQYLCAHRYEMCTREAILIAVWELPAADMPLWDAKSSEMEMLGSTLKRLRAAVEETPAHPRFILTQYRRGIRLVDGLAPDAAEPEPQAP